MEKKEIKELVEIIRKQEQDIELYKIRENQLKERVERLILETMKIKGENILLKHNLNKLKKEFAEEIL